MRWGMVPWKHPSFWRFSLHETACFALILFALFLCLCGFRRSIQPSALIVVQPITQLRTTTDDK
jgi:hypothetical protein